MPEMRSDVIRKIVNAPHQFSYENGICLTEVSAGYAKGQLTVGPNSLNPEGNVHGGALATLADTVGGCCACSTGGHCVTASSSMEFLRPASGKQIICVATPKKMGHYLPVIQVQLENELGVLVATGTYTFFMSWDDEKRE